MFFFLPTGSNAQTSRRPVITIVLASLCVAVFLWTALVDRPSPLAFSEAQDFADERPWLVDEDYEGERPAPDELAADKKQFEILLGRALDHSGGVERKLCLVPAKGFAQVGWITGLFVHFDIFHLLGNMLFLWLVGPLLEEAWGRRRFLAFYLAAGLFASLVQFAMSRASMSSIGGASGAIAGCMGAFTFRFALTKIRFHYFLWFIRIFVGYVHVPAWICGLLWFGRELMDLKGGGASGVATGAHVGGFVLGGLVALGMKALGSDRTLLTVAESDEVRTRREGLFADATSSLASGDAELARERLIALQQEAPDYPGAAMLMAQADVLSGRGVARLERVFRPLLANRGDRTIEVTLTRLWSSVDPKAFSQAFAWQLVERLQLSRPAVAPEMIDALIKAVAEGTGALAIKARALMAPPVEERVVEGPKVISVTLIAASREGLKLSVNGVEKVVPFQRVVAVHGGIVERRLWVDVVLQNEAGQRMALRLSGTDAVVPSLFPGKPVPVAWQSFIAATRRAAGVQGEAAQWEEYFSMEALAQSWSMSG